MATIRQTATITKRSNKPIRTINIKPIPKIKKLNLTGLFRKHGK
jgi:hypothetical protein